MGEEQIRADARREDGRIPGPFLRAFGEIHRHQDFLQDDAFLDRLCRSFRAFANDKNRAVRMAHDAFRGAPEREVLPSPVSVRRHHEQVRFDFVRELRDFLERFAAPDMAILIRQGSRIFELNLLLCPKEDIRIGLQNRRVGDPCEFILPVIHVNEVDRRAESLCQRRGIFQCR